MRSPVSLLVDGLRPSPFPVPPCTEACFPVGRIIDGGRSWRVFVANLSGLLLTLDDDGACDWAEVLRPDLVDWDDAWARGFARRCGAFVPLGGAK